MVVGAGFIGSEVAATCRGLGARVTVVEALPQPLARVLGSEMGAVCGALHTQHGVDLLTDVGVVALRRGSGGGTVNGVELDNGTVLDADVVVIGIGVMPTTQWLEGSGLEISDGVVADATLHAADDVVVAGDMARWFDRGLGAQVRIEHWTNAAEQGVVAARSLLAGRAQADAYVPVPYFWSDQYDVKIQVIGHPRPDDDDGGGGRVAVRAPLRGALRARRPAQRGAGVQPSPSTDGVPPPARGGGELRRRAGASSRLRAPAPLSTPARGSSPRKARMVARIWRSSSGVG